MKQKIRSVEDFLLDEKFQQFVSSQGSHHRQYWKIWLDSHPESEENFNLAYQLAKQMIAQDNVPDNYKSEVWQRIKTGISNSTPLKVVKPEDLTGWRYEKTSYNGFLKIAAVLIAIVVFTVLLYLNYKQHYLYNYYSTNYAETTTINLPDSTQIILNANSQVKVPKDFNQRREVWLDGEAYFKVAEKEDRQNFIVYANGVNVEVLGTEFSINNRHNKTRVVLNNGKVKLYQSKQEFIEDTVYMKPGDLVEIINSKNEITQKRVDPEVYNSWRNKILIFKQTSFEDIAQIIEDTYGYEVVFESPELEHQKFTGTSPNDNVNVLLEKLEKLYEVNIQVEEGKIIFNNK
jgi:ferric-dicitrate binding protein FerR (iron transport regulator)